MKPDGEKPDVDTALSDEAIDWLVRLHSGRATPKDHAAFTAWRQRSEDHERAAREAEALWQGIGVAGNQVRKAERKKKLTRRALLGGSVLLASGVALERSGVLGPHLLADHVTGIGEQRTIALADGSSAFLNADSALSANLGGQQRRLTLFKGEALFTVAHNPARPFVVETIGGRTQAIGTVFDIDIRPGEVVVTVLDGAVEVVTTNDEPSDAVIVKMDQRVRYGGAGGPLLPEDVNSDVETAWRRGKLIFNRKPLADVVAELERYRHGRIVIMSDRLRSLEVTGVFDLSDPESVLRTIESTLPVSLIRFPLVTLLR